MSEGNECDVNDLAFARPEDDCPHASEIASEQFMLNDEIALVTGYSASFVSC